MKRGRWIALVIGFSLLAQGCIIPRTVGGVLKGTGKVIEGTADAVTAPFK